MDNKTIGWKIIFTGIGLVSLFLYIQFYASRALFLNVSDILSNADIIKINVYGLFIPVGMIGLVVYFICGVITAIRYKKQAHSIWSYKTQKTFNFMTGFFAVLGLVFAIGTYQWLTSKLDERGYVYSKEDSRLSAMGKHEVYIKKIDKTGQTL